LQAAEREISDHSDAVHEKLEIPKNWLRFAGKRVFGFAAPKKVSPSRTIACRGTFRHDWHFRLYTRQKSPAFYKAARGTVSTYSLFRAVVESK